MSNLDKLNRLRSFYERNRLVSNANELISASIKSQLSEINRSSDTNTDVSDTSSVIGSQNSNYSSQNDTDESEEYQSSSSSDDTEDEESDYRQSEIDLNDSNLSNVDSGPYNEFSHSHESKSQRESKSLHPDILDNENDEFCKDLQHVKSENRDRNFDMEPKNGSKTGCDNQYLKNVFSNLENNLSKVRLGYQASLTNRSLESSILKKNFRRSQSVSSLKSTGSVHTTTDNPQSKNIATYSSLSRFYSNSSNKITRSSSFSNLSMADSNKPNDFNLNNWYNELPPGLRNFVEIESSKNSADRNSSSANERFNESNVNYNKIFDSNKDKKTQVEESKSSNNSSSSDDRDAPGPITNTSESEANGTKLGTSSYGSVPNELKTGHESGRYINMITKDYIKPIKTIFSENFKNDLKDELMYFKEDLMYLRDGIVDLYNKSPKVLKNLIKQEDSESELNENENENEKIEKKLIVNPNSYYLQSSRNTGSIVSNYLADDAKHLLKTGTFTGQGDERTEKDKNKFKVFNIYDKYESFDISDQTKLTHVSSYDINNPNQDYSLAEEDESDEDEGRVVKSISDYNIEFLSNLSKVNEKCNMLNTHKISCNLIKPWFTNPINEKIQINSNRSKLSKSSRLKTDKKHVFDDNNIKYIIKNTEGSVKYIIDDVSKPNNNEVNKKGPINLYDIENYYNEVDYEYQNDEGKMFYDPIAHFKKIKNDRKKTVNNTEWATFGRPLVKKNK